MDIDVWETVVKFLVYDSGFFQSGMQNTLDNVNYVFTMDIPIHCPYGRFLKVVLVNGEIQITDLIIDWEKQNAFEYVFPHTRNRTCLCGLLMYWILINRFDDNQPKKDIRG